MPIIGVNTFVQHDEANAVPRETKLIRSGEEEKTAQIKAVDIFKCNNRVESKPALQRLQQAVQDGDNTFAVLMESAKHCTLGEITQALYGVVGRYRRRV